jgi:hypothetical protein
MFKITDTEEDKTFSVGSRTGSGSTESCVRIQNKFGSTPRMYQLPLLQDRKNLMTDYPC